MIAGAGKRGYPRQEAHRAEARRLRAEFELTVTEIGKRLSPRRPKATVYAWVRDIPVCRRARPTKGVKGFAVPPARECRA